MAITFTPLGGAAITIGGTDTASGENGGIGPFPRYSINREDSVTGDGSYIGTKYTINVTGTAVLATSPTFSTQGLRQNAVQLEAGRKLAFNLDQKEFQGAGLLEITPYGGLANKLKFPDARITSIELPEQNEDSAGVQYLEYAFTFEAYDQTGSPGSPASQDYLISTAEENWEISENEGVIGYEDSEIDGTPFKTYNITHTVSATGRKNIASSAVVANGEAWAQAKGWVKARLTDTYVAGAPDKAIDKNTTGTDATTAFDPRAMGDSTDKIIDLLSQSYQAYNKVRQISSDVAAGSYSVTDTFMFSPFSQKATHEIEVSVEGSQEAAASTVSVNGTIQGLETNTTSTVNTISKYDNAKTELDTVLAKAYGIANQAYLDTSLTGTLRTLEISKTVGHNKSTGTITWSVAFDDLEISNDDYLREDVTVTYSNPDQNNDIVAIIGIIGLRGGPIIQDMQTTNESKTSVSVDITVKKEARGTAPDGKVVALEYQPASPVFQESETETWNPKTGVYNYSIAWLKSDNVATRISPGTGSGGGGGGGGGGDDDPDPPDVDSVAAIISICSYSRALWISEDRDPGASVLCAWSGTGQTGDTVRFYAPGLPMIPTNLLCGRIARHLDPLEISRVYPNTPTDADGNYDPGGQIISIHDDCYACDNPPTL